MNAQLFIASSISQTAALESLTTGQLGMYGIDTVSMQTINLSPTSKVDTAYLALGKGNGKAWLSREIKDIQSRNFTFKKMPYRAAVKEVTQATIDCLGTSIYDEFSLRITASGLFEGFEGIEYFAKTFSVTGKFTTFTALYEALAASVIIPSDMPFVDSVVGNAAGVFLTAAEGVHLNVSLTLSKDESDTCAPCAFCEAVVTTTNSPDSGSGTYAHVKALQAKWAIWAGRGYMADRKQVLPIETVVVNPATTWDLYQFKWTNGNQPTEDNGAVFNVYQEYMIAVPAGTNMSYYTQTMEALTGKTQKVVALV